MAQVISNEPIAQDILDDECPQINENQEQHEQDDQEHEDSGNKNCDQKGLTVQSHLSQETQEASKVETSPESATKTEKSEHGAGLNHEELGKELIELHHKIDKILGRHGHSYLSGSYSLYGSTLYRTSPTKSVKFAEEHLLRSSPDRHSHTHSHSRSHSPDPHANPYSKPDALPSYSTLFTKVSAVNAFKPGYDKEKLDQILSRIMGNKTSYEVIKSFGERPLHSPVPSTHSHSHHSHHSHHHQHRDHHHPPHGEHHHPPHGEHQLHHAHGEPAHHERPKEEYYCGPCENDVDSIILEHINSKANEIETNKATYTHYYTGELVDDVEEKPKVKKIGKRQEILNAKKGFQNSNEFVQRGPYEQKTKPKVGIDEAQKHFEKDPNRIDDYDF